MHNGKKGILKHCLGFLGAEVALPSLLKANTSGTDGDCTVSPSETVGPFPTIRPFLMAINRDGLASGYYIYKMNIKNRNGSFEESKKMIVK